MRFQLEFNNIILIDQENQGVSVARNTGVDKAEGKYLLFVDPDDFVQEDSLGSIIKDAEEQKAQIAMPGCTFIDLNGSQKIIKDFLKHEKEVFTGMQAYYIINRKGQIMSGLAVGIIFESEFINKYHLRFVPGVIVNQDVEFMTRVHCLAERCIFANHKLYMSVARKGSATRSSRLGNKHIKGFVIASKNLMEFQSLPQLKSSQKTFLNGPILQFVIMSLAASLRTRSVRTLISTVKLLKESGLVKVKSEGSRRLHRIFGYLYNLSPYLGAFVSVIYHKFSHIYWIKLKKIDAFTSN